MEDKDKNKYIDVVRFSALMNTADEYMSYVEDTLVELFTKNQYSKYNFELLNRSQRNMTEKMIKQNIENYKKQICSLKKRLNIFSNIFGKEDKFHYVFENMIESLHGTLRSVEFTKKDSFIEHYIAKSSEIEVKERTTSELESLKVLLDYFINKDINGK